MKKHLLNIKYFVLNCIGRFWDKFRADSEKTEACKAIIRQIAPMTLIACEKHMSNFNWTRDPIKGYFDYASYPWFTLYRGGGDCDDFSLYWVNICRDIKSVQFSVVKAGDNHRMACFYSSGNYVITSNKEIEFLLTPHDVNIVDKYGKIESFRDAVIAATKILYRNTKVDKIYMRNKKGYITEIIDQLCS